MSVGDAGRSARAAQLLYAYARAVDTGNIEALRGLAVPDVLLTRSDGTRQGIEAFLDLYRDFAASPVQASKHVIANVQAFPEPHEPHEPDEPGQPGGSLRALAYFEATMFDADAQTRLVIGEYSDSMREVDGELRFTHKRITVQRVVTISPGRTQHAEKP